MSRTNPTTAPDPSPYLVGLRLRGALLMGLCLILMCAMSVRLAWVHSSLPDRLATFQCFRNSRTGIIPASRGRIFDATGRPLADNRTIHTLFVNPSLVPDEQREELAVALHTHLGFDLDEMRDVLSDTESTRYNLVREMTPDKLALFQSYRNSREYSHLMREVGIWTREARVYPLGPLAGPVIGFTASRDDGQVGLWGLEGCFDDVLAGRNGRYEDLRDQRGQRIPGSRRVTEPSRNGSDLILTLDADFQALAEAALQRGIDRTGSIGGIVIITEPSSGEIRTLASLPALDPSNYQEFLEDENSLFSRSTCLSYESGSVIKVFTFAAALEERIIQPDSVFHVTYGPLRFRGGSVPEHRYGPPDVSLRDAVVHSSNRAAALVAVDLGPDRLIGRLRDFGFGQRTDIAMPGEPEGDLKEWLVPLPEIDLANMGFGHGIAVSPLQLAQAMGVFANDGVLVPLRLIRARRDSPWGLEVAFPTSPPRRILSPETVEVMEDYMIGVVEEGTATRARSEWLCAGKTGTAQKVNPEGGYYQNRFFSTFVGYGPLPDPKWLIVVIFDEPGYPHFGGTACAPVFREIFNALMLRNGEAHRDDWETAQPGLMIVDEDEEEMLRLSEYVISASPFDAEEQER